MNRKIIFILMVIISITFFSNGCKKDSPEFVLSEFFRLIKAGQGSRAFEKYVDLDDLADYLGYKNVSESQEVSEGEIKHSGKDLNDDKFLVFWERNSKELNELFLDQIKRVDTYIITEEEETATGFVITVKTVYKDRRENLEQVELVKDKDSYKIKLSTLKEVKEDV